MSAPRHLRGLTTHARRGGPENAFRYGVDYVLIDPQSDQGPTLFSRNRSNLISVHDRDHGGPRDNGEGLAWAARIFAENRVFYGQILLLTQPRFLGFWFNPVSFWLAMEGPHLMGVIAEVNNPFGDRHSYFVANDDRSPILPSEVLEAHKVFHVSPFQRIAGSYRFRFKLSEERIAISITLDDGDQGLVATLAGPLSALTNRAILLASLRRPAGAARTLALIYWQALKLKLKGARYRNRPEPPTEEVT